MPPPKRGFTSVTRGDRRPRGSTGCSPARRCRASRRRARRTRSAPQSLIVMPLIDSPPLATRSSCAGSRSGSGRRSRRRRRSRTPRRGSTSARSSRPSCSAGRSRAARGSRRGRCAVDPKPATGLHEHRERDVARNVVREPARRRVRSPFASKNVVREVLVVHAPTTSARGSSAWAPSSPRSRARARISWSRSVSGTTRLTL